MADTTRQTAATGPATQDQLPPFPPLTTRTIRELPPLPHTDAIQPTGAVREYHLVAAPFRWELVKGVTIDAWGFNDQVPGPLIRATEGDLVRVTVENRLPSPTSVHWHGLHVPNRIDGVAPMTQHHLAPGARETYEFVANHAGTFFYHSHVDEIQQMDLGVYGALIIDPQDPTGHPAYDRDYVLVLSGWAVEEGHPAGHAGGNPAGHGGQAGAEGQRGRPAPGDTSTTTTTGPSTARPTPTSRRSRCGRASWCGCVSLTPARTCTPCTCTGTTSS